MDRRTVASVDENKQKKVQHDKSIEKTPGHVTKKLKNDK